jgi:aryl sulfotransferase
VGKIIWLASYPKSGNTWMRAVLTNYLRNTHQPVDINELDGGPVAGARDLFDEQVGLESSDLTPEEILAHRPQVYESLAADATSTLFLKIHDACLQLPNNQWLVSAQATQGAVYILRNPFDVAISFAHHNNISIEKTIKNMANPDYSLGERLGHLDLQMRQPVLTWSGHVCSWIDQKVFPVHAIRYEDMHRDPGTTFRAAFQFMGFEEEPDRLNRALKFSNFKLLQEQEQAHGFNERSSRSELAFFRRGEAGSWRSVLTTEQVDQIVNAHAEVMRRFGYLSETGEILC